jgi:hypothetical protein
MNGKPGDHPLTDILGHKLEVYGQETDELILRIREMCSLRELEEWWQRELGWSASKELALQRARVRYEELLIRAREGGWEST